MTDRPRSTEPPELESRITALPVEVRGVVGGSHRIGGLAAAFNSPSRDLGGFVEKVAEKAFAKSAGDGWPGAVCRFNHSDEMLLGTVQSGTLDLSIDNRGLNYVVALPECRQDVWELVQRHDIAYSSFAFQTYSDDWGYQDGTALRTLLSVRLIDVAPVVTPAYTSTSAGLRSLARFVDAPLADVAERAQRNELRAFFVRTDATGRWWPPTAVTARAIAAATPTPHQRLAELMRHGPYGPPPTTPKDGRVALTEIMGRRWGPDEL
jgi:uncharacterized protein